MQVNGSVGQQQIAYRGYLDCVRSMARTEGLAAFYRGFTVSCIKTAPSAALQASIEPPAQTWSTCMSYYNATDVVKDCTARCTRGDLVLLGAIFR